MKIGTLGAKEAGKAPAAGFMKYGCDVMVVVRNRKKPSA